MDYNDNEFQSQNLQLAGEESTKFPPVLRPYALPKFDFDDSLHGNLRFDSLVETEVFLGIESNEDNQWIEEYSRGSSGVEFRTSAPESCSISRHNNVWSEATSSESVEMLLKSVGQEENIHGKIIMRESDACDELGCIIKQMESGPKRDDNNLSKEGDVIDVQTMLPPGEILGNFSRLKDDVGGGQPLAGVTSQKNECESSVDGDLSDPISDALSGKDSLPLSKESIVVDQRKVDASLESPNNRTTEDSSASGTQFDGVVTSAQNINISSGELRGKDAPLKNTDISEHLTVLQTEIGQQGESCCVQEAETSCQNFDRMVTDSSNPQSENTLYSASMTETTKEGNGIETTAGKTGDPANMLKKDTDLHLVEACNENVQAAECINQVSLKDFDSGDASKVIIHEISPVTSEHDKSFESHEVAVSNAYGSEGSLLSSNENKISKSEAAGSSGSYKDAISILNVASAELIGEKPEASTSKGVDDDSGICREDSNAEVNASSFTLGDSAKAHQENAVSRQSGVSIISVHVKESTEPPSDCSNMDHEVGGRLIMDKGAGSLSLGECSTENVLMVSKSPSDAAGGNESALEKASLASHEATEGALLPCDNVIATNATIIHQEGQMMDTCNEEDQCDSKVVVPSEGSQECLNEMDGSVVSDSARTVHGAEAQVISEEHEVVTVKENDEKTSSKISDTEPLPKNREMLEQPLSLPSEKIHCDLDKNGQEENESMSISADKISGRDAAPYIKDDALKTHEAAIRSTPLSESDAKLCDLESGSSCTNLDNSACGSPTVIRATELSQSGNEKNGVKGSADHDNPESEGIDGDANKLQSVSLDSKGNDASEGEKTFTFEVSPLADSSGREAEKNWQPFSTVEATTVSPIVEGSSSSSGLGQLSSKIAQDASHGNLQVLVRENVRSASKANSERKTRRVSSKATAKETAKKGTPRKDATSARQSEKGDRISNVSLSPSGISQLVQSNEMQRYGHVDGSSVKSFVLTSSISSLPDLNASSSSLFQQPFTDLQQVQLRAQIFVYGALIQGTAPDEAYMISAFGGPDGGRNVWETAWHAYMERLHGQKPVVNNTEIPMQSSSGKVTSSPLGRATSKGTPAPIVNPIIPLSSPLWSISAPLVDTLQSSGMPKSAVMDYQQALSPLHPHQTPPIRNFVGHNTSWISQAPFRGTWVASPQTSGFDTGVRFPLLPITETIQHTPVKEASAPHSSGVKHVSSGPIIQNISPATVFPGTSTMLDPRKMTLSPSQHPTDPKRRKRKKTSVSEGFGQTMLHMQSQTQPVSAPIVDSHMSTSVSVTTPGSIVSKASTEKVVMPISPATSADLLGNKEAQRRPTFSEDTITKLKEAKTQAEDAAAFAASAVGHSQDIWNQLDKQKNSGLVPDVESKLASAAIAIAAAAAVAKAAAAAANVASSAAFQAKLMADEALDLSGCGNSTQINGTFLSDSVKDMRKATPVSILKGENAISSSSSIIFAAREAARRKVEAASAASKRAENMDAIVRAAELAAEAVSQAGRIVAMGDPLPLIELIEAGPEGYWKVSQASAQLAAKLNKGNSEKLNIDRVGEGAETSAKHSKEVPLNEREMQTSNQGTSSTSRNMFGESFDDHDRMVDGLSGSVAASRKNAKGQKGSKASDLGETIGVPGSEIGSRSPSITIQFEQESGMEPLKENSIKEGSCVEVFKEGLQFKAGWFTANVLSLKDGQAYVCYNELPSHGGGSEKLKEWVGLKGEGDQAPKIRIARPVTAMPFEGTRKRRRAAMGGYKWSVGETVDAWMEESWWEGVVTEKSEKDETMFTVHFPAQGETSDVRAWHLRPSLTWKDGEWVECSSSAENNRSSHQGDTPKEKRLRLGGSSVELKGKDKMSKSIGIVEAEKPDEPTLLDLAANEKLFNIGKSKNENEPDALRMIRTGLQKEGSRVVFGVPKPGKKRKFMDVSKHYVVDRGDKVSEANDSVKFAKYLMPQSQGTVSRGWKNASRSDPKEKRAAVSKPKVLKSGKAPSVSGRTIPQKSNSSSSAASAPDDGAGIDHMTKIKDFARHVENTSGKHDAAEFQSTTISEGAAEAPMVFSSMPLSSVAPSKKVSASNPKTDRMTKAKLAPAGGKLTKIEEDKVFSGNSAKTSSEVAEPRRSNRRIQPTSRLLEGLQSSLIISKIPSVSHERSHKSQQNKSSSRGNNHG